MNGFFVHLFDCVRDCAGLRVARHFFCSMLPGLLESQFVLFFKKLFRYSAVDEREVYWINVRIENHLIKVPNNDGESRQHSFVKMYGEGDIDPPAGQKA